MYRMEVCKNVWMAEKKELNKWDDDGDKAEKLLHPSTNPHSLYGPVMVVVVELARCSLLKVYAILVIQPVRVQ